MDPCSLCSSSFYFVEWKIIYCMHDYRPYEPGPSWSQLVYLGFFLTFLPIGALQLMNHSSHYHSKSAEGQHKLWCKCQHIEYICRVQNADFCDGHASATSVPVSAWSAAFDGPPANQCATWLHTSRKAQGKSFFCAAPSIYRGHYYCLWENSSNACVSFGIQTVSPIYTSPKFALQDKTTS